MDLHINILQLPLLLSSLFSVVTLALVIHRTKKRFRQPVAYLIVGVILYSGFYLLETSSHNLVLIILFSKLKYIGAVTIPVSFFLFALSFVESKDYLQRDRYLYALYLVPGGLLLCILIPGLQHLVFPGYELLYTGDIILHRHTLGPLFWVHFVYSYLMTLMGAFLLLRDTVSSDQMMRRSSLSLVAASIIPLMSNVAHLFFSRGILKFYDITPITFAVSSVFLGFVILNYRIDDFVYLTYDSLLKNLKEGMIVLDHETRIVEINEAAAALFRRSPEDMKGQVLQDTLIKNRGLIDRFQSVYEAKSETEIYVGEDTRICQLHISPLKDRRLPAPGRIVLIWDVTERRKAEEQAVRAARLESLELLAGGVAHDFNNLLTGIYGNLTLARLENRERQVAEHLDTMAEGLEQAAALTRQLRGFASQNSPRMEQVYLPRLIKDSLALFLRGTDIHTSFSAPEDLWDVFTDPGQISQVVNNLIVNAVQAQDGNGSILVKVENVLIESVNSLQLPQGRYVHTVFADGGPGISGENLSRIFDPYFTTKQTGTGLGLASALSIVNKNRGSLYAEDRTHEGSMGKSGVAETGACFHLYLPSLGNTDALWLKDSGESINRAEGIEHVVLLDRIRDSRLILSAYLTRLGYQVECFGDADELTRYFSREDVPEVDCIISEDRLLQISMDIPCLILCHNDCPPDSGFLQPRSLQDISRALLSLKR